MATNVVAVNVYQINQKAPIPLNQVTKIGFPTQGILIRDTSNSPTKHLSTGVYVYSAIQTVNNDLYYSEKTQSALIALFNA
jgi:hypothetical protein